MYNGIGLNTARGSGTNGYVVRNLSAIPRGRREPVKQFQDIEEEHKDRFRERKPNEEILLHERKRQVELQCLTLRLALEEEEE
jgi:serine/arginine repetitive matrix protein 2